MISSSVFMRYLHVCMCVSMPIHDFGEVTVVHFFCWFALYLHLCYNNNNNNNKTQWNKALDKTQQQQTK